MFLALLCLLSTAVAQDNAGITVDYVDITKNEVAPFSGKLFTEEALAKMLATHQVELSSLTASYEFDIQKQKLDLDLKYDLLNSKYTSEVVMYQQMIQVRDDQLKKSARKDILQKWATYGGFVLGAATSVAIMYSVNSN